MNFARKIINKLISIFNNNVNNLNLHLLNFLTKGVDSIDFSISVDTPEDLERIRSDKGVILLM